MQLWPRALYLPFIRPALAFTSIVAPTYLPYSENVIKTGLQAL
jgi:hypothetical protein